MSIDSEIDSEPQYESDTNRLQMLSPLSTIAQVYVLPHKEGPILTIMTAKDGRLMDVARKAHYHDLKSPWTRDLECII